MREVPAYQPPSVHREGAGSSPEIRLKRDTAVKRLLEVADYLAGPPSETPNFYHFVSDQLKIVAVSRRIQVDTEQQKKPLPSPEGTQTLVVTPPPLTTDELAEATTAVWEHDEMTPEMRRNSGLPLNDEGLPIAADVEACLEFIDDQDPEEVFTLKAQEEETTECTHSCNCYKAGIIKPEHRQAVLTRNGMSYDPPGTSPRNKELRDAWRREQSTDRTKIRGYGRARENAFRGTNYHDTAVPFGAPQQVTWEVNPLYVEAERDGVREEIGLPTVVDPRLHPYLQREYVLDATARIIEEGYTPPTPQELLDRRKNSPLEEIDARKGWRRFIPGKTTASELETLRDEARERVAAELEAQGFFDTHEPALDSGETLDLHPGELPDQRAIDAWTNAREAARNKRPTEDGTETEVVEEEPNEFKGLDLDTLLQSEPPIGETVRNPEATALVHFPRQRTPEDGLRLLDEEPQVGASTGNTTIADLENAAEQQRAINDKGKTK